jgi:glycosyltransferase involved in cell wall biosynthesis
MRTSGKPLLLVISQVYVPDPASVGQHMADAAEAMAARGYEVRVLTSARGYENPHVRYPGREQRGGVEVRRLAWSSFGKKSLVHRVIGQVLFLVQVIVVGLFRRRLAGILVSTSPPMASFAAIVIGTVRRVPITYWLMDLNPDQAVALGRVSPRSGLVACMKWLNRQIFARAAAVIVLDRFMAERVRQQYRIGGRLEVLPPWPHVASGESPKRYPAGSGEQAGCSVLSDSGCEASGSAWRDGPANSFAAEHNLAGRFVVMYSGNHSLASPVTTLVSAARALGDDERFVFLFVGGGLGKRVVDEAIATHRPPNILSLPYQPLERLGDSLSAADVHAVTLGNEMVGIIHPCKIYGAMAVGRPILFVGPRPSHAADLVDRHQIGWQVEQGDVAGAVAALRAAAALAPAERAAIGQRASVAVSERYSRRVLCDAFCDVVERSMRAEASGGCRMRRAATGEQGGGMLDSGCWERRAGGGERGDVFSAGEPTPRADGRSPTATAPVSISGEVAKLDLS